MLRKITITVSEDAARWARRKAADENTSVSKLVGRMLEAQIRLSDEYWLAYERWNRVTAVPGIDAGSRPGRDELHERR